MSWTKRVKHPSKIVAIGDEVEAMVLDLDVSQKRISLGLKQCEPNPWNTLSQRYPVGTVIRGPIRNITDFGVFVGVEEGIDGLVHVSDLSWSGRVKHPGEMYEKGVDVEAVVLNIDIENERFSLGIKQLTDDPWRAMPDRYTEGRTVDGRVLKVSPTHAFIELEPGIEGALDVQDYDGTADLSSVLKPGDAVRLRIREVDVDQHQISLGLR